MQTLAPLPSPQLKTSRTTLLIALVFLMAAATRIPGLFTDFWGDEIWSWSIAGQLHSISDVIMAPAAHIDNNHPLNTLFLYLMGQNRPVWLYRLPSLLAGIGSVLLATLIMLRRGLIEAASAALLLGLSYPLIFYSSEARGYSLAVFFSLLSFHFLSRALSATNPHKRSGELFFGLACTAGFLSHLTFLHIYAGAVAWSLFRIRRLEPTTRLRFLRLARLHALPLLCALFLFRFLIRDMVIGGAAPTSPTAVFLQTIALTAGGATSGYMALLPATIVGLGFAGGLIYLCSEKDADSSGQWLFFLFAVVISPALVCTRNLMFSDRPQPLMLRYFLVCMAAALLCVCPLAGGLWRRGTRFRALVACLLVAYVAGNGRHMARFLELGRGHYAQALAEIVQQTPQANVAISSDNANRTEMLIRFYGPRVAPGRIILIKNDPCPWLILNRLERSAAPQIYYRTKFYRLIHVWPATDLSGWVWQVYYSGKPLSPAI